VGASITCAPSARSAAASEEAWARARVTATVVPASGPGARHSSCACSAATSPITVIAGACRPAAAASAAIVASVPSTVRCCGSVPWETTAAGWLSGRPASISRAHSPGRVRTPM
jgi:hypothetical protein